MAQVIEAHKAADIPAGTEPIYTVDEFAANARKIFGRNISSDIVNAAFMVSDTKRTTISHARKIVNDFITGEVK